MNFHYQDNFMGARGANRSSRRQSVPCPRTLGWLVMPVVIEAGIDLKVYRTSTLDNFNVKFNYGYRKRVKLVS
jgi:hypothetical protein